MQRSRKFRARWVPVLALSSLAIAAVAPAASSPAAAASPALRVTHVFPPVVAAGTQHGQVTLSGAGFVDGTTITVSGTGVETSGVVFATANVLGVVLRVHHNAPLTARTLLLHTPDGAVHRCHDCLTIVAQPTSTDAYPATVGQNAHGALMLVHGTGFDQYVGGVIDNGVHVRSAGAPYSTSVVLTIDVERDAAPGPRDVEIVNYSYGRTVCVACLTVTPRPTLTSIEPPTLAHGTQHATLTVTGSGFQQDLNFAVAERGVYTESVVVMSDTQAIVTVSVSPYARLRYANVVLENPDHGKSKALDAFRIT